MLASDPEARVWAAMAARVAGPTRTRGNQQIEALRKMISRPGRRAGRDRQTGPARGQQKTAPAARAKRPMQPAARAAARARWRGIATPAATTGTMIIRGVSVVVQIMIRGSVEVELEKGRVEVTAEAGAVELEVVGAIDVGAEAPRQQEEAVPTRGGGIDHEVAVTIGMVIATAIVIVIATGTGTAARVRAAARGEVVSVMARTSLSASRL